MDKYFSQEDSDKVVEFMNFIAQKAEFNGWTTADTVKHFKLLAYMQQNILPKIESHVCEVEEVIDAPST